MSWRQYATPISPDEPMQDWRATAEPIAMDAPIQEQGLMYDLGERAKEADRIVAMRQAGMISRPEEMLRTAGQAAGAIGDISGAALGATLSGVDRLLGGVPSEYLGRGAKAVGSIPVGDDTLGGVAMDVLQSGAQTYGELEEDYPRVMGALEGLGNIALVAPGAKYAGDITKSAGKAVKGVKGVSIPTTQQIKKRARDLYTDARKKGAAFKDDAISEFQKVIDKNRVTDPFAKASLGNDAIDDLARNVGSIRGEKMTLESFEQLDKRLGSAASKAFRAGDNELAMRYDEIQDGLRGIVTSDDFIEGSRQGIDSYRKATKLWAQQSKMRDIDEILENAQYYVGGEGAGIKAGMARLAKSKKINRYTPAEAKAIKKAAKSGQIEGLLRTLGSRLLTIGAAVSGGATGGAAGAGIGALMGQAASSAARGGASALKGAEASKVGRLIGRSASRIDPTLSSGVSRLEGLKGASKVVDALTAGTFPAALADLTKEELDYILSLPPQEAQAILENR